MNIVIGILSGESAFDSSSTLLISIVLFDLLPSLKSNKTEILLPHTPAICSAHAHLLDLKHGGCLKALEVYSVTRVDVGKIKLND